ncbi:carbohydrate-binding domain-containing protein, partial [Methylobacterium sp. GC_Met_2]|uniref:carbohydrate-binding domain-containing protein n=1 Tax=Methylobacterium sp. GC_Met_2 TaxID=2937376 RepID=UPI0023E11C69
RFLNDAYDGSGQFSEGHDRNLYVSSVSLDGHSFGTSEADPAVLLQNGGVTIATTAATVAPDNTSPPDTSAAAGTGGTAPAVSATTIGAGANQLVLKISQDAYNGDAQYTISVDGHQIGGVQTAHAAHAAGQSDTLTVKGDFGPGDHAVSISFLNDFYGGSASTDRNLYVDGASYDGMTVAHSGLSLPNTGSQQFTVPGTGTGTGTGSGTSGTATAAAAPSAPTVALTHDTGTGGTHATSDGLVTYAPSVSGDTLHYKLDNGAVTTTTPVLATDGSADGQHTVTVYETDAAGHTSADASLVFSLDTHHDSSGFHMA